MRGDLSSGRSTGRSAAEWSRVLSDKITRAEATAHVEAAFREAAVPEIKIAIADLHGIDPLDMASEQQAGSTGPRRAMDNVFGGVIVEWEFRMNTPGKRAHGAYQALEYLHRIGRDDATEELQQALIDGAATSEQAFTAVVSDGLTWGFLNATPNVDYFFADLREADAAQYFEWVDHSPAAVLRFEELVGDHRRTPITPLVLANMFGPSSDVGRDTVALLLSALGARADGSRADTLYHEWRRAMDVVHGNLDESDNAVLNEVAETYEVSIDRPMGEALFVLHTYFALVTRLVAGQFLATAVRDEEFLPTKWASLDDSALVAALHRFDGGELPGGLDISNLFEIDLFSWYLDDADGNTDLIDGLRRVLLSLDRLAFPSAVHGSTLMGDVLRDMYQRIVPSAMRRALGEFLTPHWLAEAARERLGSLGAPMQTGRVLDPTCGTGTFLTPILSRRVKELKTQGRPSAAQVQEVLNSVAGIDLNPVAVIATRANFVMALGDLAAIGPITLSVWRADSLIVPEPAPIQRDMSHPLATRDYREIQTSLAEPFPVPELLARADRLTILRRLIESKIHEFEDTREPNLDRFEVEFTATFGPSAPDPVTLDTDTFENELEVASHLYARILELAEANQNGVWAGIIENAFAPVFAGRFDIVIGNPPWLAWPKLPRAWRGDAERLWARYGLWDIERDPGQPVAPQFNDIATLVFAVAIERYATDNGWVGLLTPEALLIADPGARAFRKFHLRSASTDGRDVVDIPFAPQYIDNWSQINPFSPDAANRPVFIIARKGEPFSGSAPGSVWRRRTQGTAIARTWSETKPLLEAEAGSYAPVSPQVPTSALRFQADSGPALIEGGTNHYAFGMGLNTRGGNGIYFVEITQSDHRNGLVRIHNLPAEGRNREVGTRTGQVEAELVYPLLRGRDVTAWEATPSGFVVFPHRPDDPDRVLSSQAWDAYPKAGRWLRQFRTILRQRSTIASARWNLAGDDWCRLEGPFGHMRSLHVVVVREQAARPAAAVLERRMDYTLNRSTTPLVDHKLILCAVESSDEALFLAAFINSTPVQDLIESFGSATAISPTTMRRIPVPRFDPSDTNAHAIVTAAKKIMGSSDRASKAAEVQPTIDAGVLALVQVDPNDHQPQPRRRATSRPRRDPDDGVLF